MSLPRSTVPDQTHTKPFLRWAGGKKWFIRELKILTKNLEYNNYHEPFLGGGSVFFAMNPKNAYLSDLNDDLINAYNVVKKFPDEIIDKLKSYQNTEAFYYEIRGSRFQTEIDKAAQFIFLNRTSYNGIHRVNTKGEYNVPYGFKKNYEIGAANILRVSKILQSASIESGDFTKFIKNIHGDDLVFLDPPYTVSHNNNGFIEYNKKLFSLDDQNRLSSYIDLIKKRGAFYILTNAAHPAIKEIFDKDDRILEFKRVSTIGGKSAKRDRITEYVFTNIELDI